MARSFTVCANLVHVMQLRSGMSFPSGVKIMTCLTLLTFALTAVGGHLSRTTSVSINGKLYSFMSCKVYNNKQNGQWEIFKVCKK